MHVLIHPQSANCNEICVLYHASGFCSLGSLHINTNKIKWMNPGFSHTRSILILLSRPDSAEGADELDEWCTQRNEVWTWPTEELHPPSVRIIVPFLFFSFFFQGRASAELLRSPRLRSVTSARALHRELVVILVQFDKLWRTSNDTIGCVSGARNEALWFSGRDWMSTWNIRPQWLKGQPTKKKMITENVPETSQKAVNHLNRRDEMSGECGSVMKTWADPETPLTSHTWSIAC